MDPSKFINKSDIRQAIKSDARFRDLFPELASEIKDFLYNPSCPCHDPLVDKIMKATDRLHLYFPNKQVLIQTPSKSEELWTIINTNINELDEKLRRLPVGRKQISVARFEDQVTVIVNMLVQM